MVHDLLTSKRMRRMRFPVCQIRTPGLRPSVLEAWSVFATGRDGKAAGAEHRLRTDLP